MNEIKSPVYGFSALAENSLFENKLKQSLQLTGFTGFRDHHSYSQNDIDSLRKKANGIPLVCTEKDWIKIKDLEQVDGILVVQSKLVPQNSDLMDWIKSQLN